MGELHRFQNARCKDKKCTIYLMFAWWRCRKKQTRNQRSVGICEVTVTFFAGCHCPLRSRSAGLSLMWQRAEHSSPNLFFFLIKWSVLLFRTPGYQGSLMAFPSLAPQIMRRLITPRPLPAKRFLVCHIYLSFEADGQTGRQHSARKEWRTTIRAMYVSAVIKKLWLTVGVSKSILFRASLIYFTSSLRP
jgi:hypothetical protein